MVAVVRILRFTIENLQYAKKKKKLEIGNFDIHPISNPKL